MVHKRSLRLKRNILLGPIRAALGLPPSWLDDLDPHEAIKTIHSATALLPPELIDEDFAAWGGVEAADE